MSRGGSDQWPAELLADGYAPVETGYSVSPDGSARVSVLTPMPGVGPRMWDWWFASHSGHAKRYKLWRSQVHVHAICSGGHSWAQNHIRDGGMMLDLSRLNRIEIDASRRTAIVWPACLSGAQPRAVAQLEPAGAGMSDR